MSQKFVIDSALLQTFLGDNYEKHLSPFQLEVISDFWMAWVSRELSLQGRREVLTGKAKFGIFGDGKEIAQLALARAMQKGDHRAGYYRDQTIMLGLDLMTVEDFLAQMYSDSAHDPFSGGRMMNAHFATPYINKDGSWANQVERYNMSAGISCTAGQMGRAIGLSFASKVYRDLDDIGTLASSFSRDGNEVCWCTIGDASTSEGVFFETVNAAAVLKLPLVIAVWDDGYGISVPTALQTTKSSISEALRGFVKTENDYNGIGLYEVKGWDYPALCKTFEQAGQKAREEFLPIVVHVSELTQPQGHSTSGSHERYKTKARLAWEKEYDGLSKMEEWMLKHEIITPQVANQIKRKARAYVRERKHKTWKRFQQQNDQRRKQLLGIVDGLDDKIRAQQEVVDYREDIKELINPTRDELCAIAWRISFHLTAQGVPAPDGLHHFIHSINQEYQQNYGTHLYAEGAHSALQQAIVPPSHHSSNEVINGYQVINRFFDYMLEKDPRLVIFGEDVGKIGDVNQGMAGLQSKHGVNRVFDTGIREWTIMGQAMGCAMRGLKPVAEIQYLDYLVYALPLLTDDIATLRYRSNNQQQAPMIIRTRGHRLEGVWHTGSPMSMILGSMQGFIIAVPRNMVQAAGMYASLLAGNDPALVIECLNGYRLKESLPDNIGEYTVPLGMPEVLTKGSDVTIVTYGSCVRIALQAQQFLESLGISIEIIDVQTLVPFDLEKIILASLKKTNKIIFMDEDIPGGATAYMMQKVIERDGGFAYLDGTPTTLTAQAHRTPYGSDGDYYAKPQVEDVVRLAYELVKEVPYPFHVQADMDTTMKN